MAGDCDRYEDAKSGRNGQPQLAQPALSERRLSPVQLIEALPGLGGEAVVFCVQISQPLSGIGFEGLPLVVD